MIISKFPVYVQDAWNKKVMAKKCKYDALVQFSDLLQFVEMQSKLLNNPFYSRDAINDTKEKRTSFGALKNFGIGFSEDERL